MSTKLIAVAAGVAAIGAAVLFGPHLVLNQATINEIPSDRAAASPAPAVDAGNNAIIDLAGHQVPVLEGGLFDRFRSNPPLSVVQEEQPALDLSWFETLKKEKKEVGFTTYIRSLSLERLVRYDYQPAFQAALYTPEPIE